MNATASTRQPASGGPLPPTAGNGIIVTFYSYKGGVGRSMAMANVAEILADAGYRVIVCDWDLEAPGLERYLFDDAAVAETYKRHPGIINLVLEYKAALASPPPKDSAEKSNTNSPAPREDEFQMVGNLRLRRPSSYAVTIPSERRRSGWIHFLSAGRRDGEWNRNYTESIRDFEWPEFYDKWAGDAYFNFFRAELIETADFVLIDSRTGVTELGGVCTHHLADAVVLFSAANDLNVEGTKWMAEILSGPGLQQIRGSRGPVAIMPVASRIEQISESNELQKFRERFITEFSRYLPTSQSRDSLFCNPQTFLGQTEIPYLPISSYRETVVARLRPENRLYATALYAAYARIADGLRQWAVQSKGIADRSSGPQEASGAGPKSAAVAMLVPKGRFFISYGVGNDAAAAGLFSGLRSVGINVWSYPMSASTSDPRAMAQVQRGFTESNGCIVLVRPADPPEWLESELSVALARRVVDPGYRVLIVTQGEIALERLSPMLSEFPRVPLSESPTTCTFNQICAELLPQQPLPSEKATASLGGVDIDHPAQALFFLGREAEVLTLLGQAERAFTPPGHCLVVCGPEGCGKTALINAGLRPALYRGWMGTARLQPCVVTFRAEGNPMGRLAQALAEALPNNPATEIERQLATAKEGLLEFIRKNFSVQRPLVLIMDSAQELFSSPENQAGEAERILGALDHSLHSSDAFFLIVCVRSDSLGPLERSPLRRQLTGVEAVYRVPPISEDGMRRYLAGSARLAGVTFEQGLEERMVSDLAREKASISDVTFVLRHLGANLHEKRLTHEAYNQLGGLGGVLADRARHVLGDLDPNRSEIARRILLCLVDGRSNERKWLSREELRHGVGSGAEVEAVFRLLRQSRVIVLNEEGHVGIAHDAILRLDTVRQWIAKAYESLKRRDELEEAAKAWEQAGRPVRKLPLRVETTRYEEVSDKTPLAEMFLRAAAQRQHQTRRLAWIAGAVGLLLLIGLSVFSAVGYRAQLELQTTRKDLAAAAVEKEELAQQAARLQATLAALNTTTNAVQDQLADLRKLNINLNSQLTNAIARRDELQKQSVSLQQQIFDLQGATNRNAQQMIALNQKREQAEADLKDAQYFVSNVQDQLQAQTRLLYQVNTELRVQQQILDSSRSLDVKTMLKLKRSTDGLLEQIGSLEKKQAVPGVRGSSPSQLPPQQQQKSNQGK